MGNSDSGVYSAVFQPMTMTLVNEADSGAPYSQHRTLLGAIAFHERRYEFLEYKQPLNTVISLHISSLSSLRFLFLPSLAPIVSALLSVMAPLLTSLTDATLANTIGAAFLGVIGAAFLFGVTTLQLYSYYHSYTKDPPFQKIAVAVLWFLDALHLALTIHAVYRYVIAGFGDLLGLLVIEWSIKLQVLINVIVIVVVHCLYTLRVCKLSGYHRGVLGYITVSILAGGFALGLFLSYKVFEARFFSDLNNIAWVIAAALGTSTAIDFFIAFAMCWYLRKSRGEGTRLNSRIDLVMQYTLSSGLLTSACSLAAMFTYLLLPNTFVFLGLEFMLTKFYVGSFLAMLNARDRKQRRPKSQEGGASDGNSLSKKLPNSSGLVWGGSPLAANICLTSPSKEKARSSGTPRPSDDSV